MIQANEDQTARMLTHPFSKREILHLLVTRRTLAIMYVGDRSAEVEYYRRDVRGILDSDDSVEIEAVQVCERLDDDTYVEYPGAEYSASSEVIVGRLRDRFGPEVRWESSHTLILGAEEDLIAWVALLDVRSVFTILKHRVKCSHLARAGALAFLDSACAHYSAQREYLEMYLCACAVELGLWTPKEERLAAVREALALLN